MPEIYYVNTHSDYHTSVHNFASASTKSEDIDTVITMSLTNEVHWGYIHDHFKNTAAQYSFSLSGSIAVGSSSSEDISFHQFNPPHHHRHQQKSPQAHSVKSATVASMAAAVSVSAHQTQTQMPKRSAHILTSWTKISSSSLGCERRSSGNRCIGQHVPSCARSASKCRQHSISNVF